MSVSEENPTRRRWLVYVKWVTLPNPPAKKIYDDLTPTALISDHLRPLISPPQSLSSYLQSISERIEEMKKMNLILKKCKNLPRQLGRTSSYSSLRSKSTREEIWDAAKMQENEDFCETIYVGSSRRRYEIKSKHMNHPLLNALIEKSNKKPGDQHLSVKCEVVLFDHLLWMLDNADPHPTSDHDSLEELADLYVL